MTKGSKIKLKGLGSLLSSNKEKEDESEPKKAEESELPEEYLNKTPNTPEVEVPHALDMESQVEPEGEGELKLKKNKSIEPKGVAGILNDIVLGALNKKASDVHIEPREADVLVRYRIDGILRDIYTIEKQYEESLLFKIKINAKLPTDEHFAPQDGRIRFVFDQKVDTRISILPTTRGEKVVIRLLTQQGKSYELNDLGLQDKDLDIVQKSYLKPYGTILASGPTGSGKTTTLYSILTNINSRDKNITTIEDPVEYDLEGVNHIQVNPKSGLTFDKGLRSILRQDPDVIMIGEIRDPETARIAINSAMTGHLVLSTIHTNDSVTTIPRLIDMGIEPYLVASTVNVVIAQRLSRKLCEDCKQKHVLSKKEHDEIKKYRPDIAELIRPGAKVFQEVGCTKCNKSGFKGRVGLYEVLEVSETIRKLISERANTDDIFHAARKQGLVLIVEDGVKKVQAGLTSIGEIMRVTALKD